MFSKWVVLFALVLISDSSIWANELIVIKVKDENQIMYLISVIIHESGDPFLNTYNLHHFNGETISPLHFVYTDANNGSIIALVNSAYEYIPFSLIDSQVVDHTVQNLAPGFILTVLLVGAIGHLTSGSK